MTSYSAPLIQTHQSFKNDVFFDKPIELNSSDAEGNIVSVKGISLNNTIVSGKVMSYESLSTKASYLYGSLQTYHFIQIEDSHVEGSLIESKAHVNIYHSTAKAIKASSFIHASRSQINGPINSESYVSLENQATAQSITASGHVEVVASQVQGLISSHSYVSVQSAKTSSIFAHHNLSLKKVEVNGNASTCSDVEVCEETFISGTLRCHNQTLEIIDSIIETLILNAPQNTGLTGISVNDLSTSFNHACNLNTLNTSQTSTSTTSNGDLVHHLKALKDAGQIQLEPNRIIIGPCKNPPVVYAKAVAHPVTIECHREGILELCTEKESAGIKFDHFSIQAPSFQEISLAIHQILNQEPPQKVLLRNSHIRQILFEKEGGIVQLLGLSSLETISKGHIQSTEEIEASHQIQHQSADEPSASKPNPFLSKLNGFKCPISRQTMQDPVIASDGHSYERAAIRDWMLNHDTSPVTREILTKELIPNHNLKKAIEDYLARRKAI